MKVRPISGLTIAHPGPDPVPALLQWGSAVHQDFLGLLSLAAPAEK